MAKKRRKQMKWIGPFQISKLLDNMMGNLARKIPPEDKSVYIVSLQHWEGKPTNKCSPLYVGSTTGKSKRFRTRIGDLIADMFGFFVGKETGHHSGGQKLYNYCKEKFVKPQALYIGWLKTSQCQRCDEGKIYKEFNDILLNKNKPNRCDNHSEK
ncbi:MAG: hypothetical protein AAB065_07815 [Deltaproteobacteria bacterium]